MEKTCTICKTQKSLSEFNKKKRNKDGLQNICQPCSRTRSKNYYKNNKEKHRKVTRANSARYSSIRKKFIKSIKLLNGCALCDEKEPCCIDFHHHKGKKILTISRDINKSLKSIKEELTKCVCLCSNCHRKLHKGLVFVTDENLCKQEQI